MFLRIKKAPDDQTLLPQWVCYHSPGIKRFHQESSSRGEETIHILFETFSVFAKMTIIWPRTSRFLPDQSSIAPPIWSIDERRWRVGIVAARGVCFWSSSRGQRLFQKNNCVSRAKNQYAFPGWCQKLNLPKNVFFGLFTQVFYI